MSQDRTNEDRAQSGRNAISAYVVENGDADNAMVDLLADLMHRAAIDCEAEDFDEALETARMHFNAEITEAQS
jgi:hypothetical protein